MQTSEILSIGLHIKSGEATILKRQFQVSLCDNEKTFNNDGNVTSVVVLHGLYATIP